MNWKQISEAEYFDQLEVLPPAFHDHRGFLQGEPRDHRICSVKGTLCAEYAAYVRVGDKCYGGVHLTLNEYKRLRLENVR